MSKHITIRILGEVASGKTHVAETIRKALEEAYGGNIDISLTDIEHDRNCGNTLAPGSTTQFKIIEDHPRK